ncbi:hypothetical protein BOTBODRAFT_47951 [Botryobasidium botryosum FD-172 SS1]|uniref:Enoyl-CoA hydratase n=1 Tax=Botryobasidium botryosum (strain FD-172 SS1) TaxID=930990 RepID=A0A067M2D5_BOTB1|nr:hypothetical protein BOTBODRAFT_47951 [Botryobasidium botryosum FD-172 SS1]
MLPRISFQRLAIGAIHRGAAARFSRSYSVALARDAFLEPVQGHPSIACLSLNRPKTKNAISMNMLKELRESLEEAASDNSISVLILRSTAPGAFCAGADLSERRTMTMAQVNKFLTNLRSTFSLLENLPMPTIAAIDGPALGGGLEMALSCDIRVAGRDATKIGLPEARLGIIPGAGGTQRAARILGLPRAKALIFTGKMLTAEEAKEWDVVDFLAEPSTTAYDRALALAQEMTNSAPLALRAAKLSISRAFDLPLESGLDFERACYAPLLKTKDRDEALEAFREKRKAIFRGE